LPESLDKRTKQQIKNKGNFDRDVQDISLSILGTFKVERLKYKVFNTEP